MFSGHCAAITLGQNQYCAGILSRSNTDTDGLGDEFDLILGSVGAERESEFETSLEEKARIN